MKTTMKKVLAIVTLLLFVLTAGCTKKVERESFVPTDKTGDIVVLFTSDVHCGIDQNFGYVGLKAAKDAAEAAGNHVILVDNGDSIQGETIGTMTKGEASIKLMNALGYDVAIPGNHEFDYGMERFLELTEMANFPYISCNFNKEGELVFDPYIIKEFDDVKIAFVGVTTPYTLNSSLTTSFKDDDGNYIYGFLEDESGEKLYEAVQQATDDARAEGAQYVVLMGHLGNYDNYHPYTYDDVISHTSGIDAVLDGHSHDSEKKIAKNKDGDDIIRQACGTKMEGIGWLRISVDGGEVDSGLYTYNNTVSVAELLGIENEMNALIEAATHDLNEKFKEVVAHSDYDLTIYDPVSVNVRIVRKMETNLGDLCADAYRYQTGADIAFINGGGVRASIAKGDITLNDIFSVNPFNNKIAVIEVSGRQILDAMEWGVRAVPGESGAFPQVSGLTYEIHSYLDSTCTQDEMGMFTGVTGEYRVKNVKVNGEPLDLDKTYTLAANDFILLNDGDGYTMFKGSKVLNKSVNLDNQMLIDYISEILGGNIGEEYANPYGQGRITIISEAQ